MPSKRKGKRNGAVVAVVGDTHIGSTVGLCPPRVELDDGGEYIPARPQRWLWQSWLNFWSYVSDLAKGRRLIVVFNGDIVDNLRHPSSQLFSRNIADILRAAQDVLEPPMQLNPEKVIFVRGTPAHVGLSAELEETLASYYNGITLPNETGGHTHWGIRFSIEGMVFDIAHHGRLGRLPWTRGNSATRDLIRMLLRDGKDAPDFVVRSHLHQKWDTFNNYPIRWIALPAWQLMTEYSHRLATIELADIGGAVFVVKDGKLLNEGGEVLWTIEPEPDKPKVVRL